MTGHAGDTRPFNIYDTKTDTWTTKAELPTSIFPIPITGASACAVNRKIYVIGGGGTPQSQNTSTMRAYDSVTDTWTLKTNMPTARSNPTAVVVDGKIFVIGGTPTSGHWNSPINPLPKITKIHPNYGLTTGGTIIIIEGTGFLSGVKVSIGKRTASILFNNELRIEAVTPPNPLGSFDLKVVNPDTQEVVVKDAFLSVSETVYNYPNPFRSSQGTTFRYVANEEVEEITVQIFNLNGEPIGLLRRNGGSEIKWTNPDLNFGLYVYQMEVQLEIGQTRTFQRLLQVE